MTSIAAVHRARVIWSVIAEVGDVIAHRLILTFGPERALALIHTAERRPTADDLKREARRITDEILSHDVPVTEQELISGLHRWLPRLTLDTTDQVGALARKCDLTLLGPEDALWPSRLNDLGESAPVLLWVRGDVELLQQDQVAITGARAATGYGEQMAREITEDLVRMGFIATCGGAFGVDASVLRSANSTGHKSIAVVACGPERAYPIAHHDLFDRIASSGAIVSAVPLGSAPTKHRFLHRNAVIAALSGAVVITESGARGGALNTVDHAVRMGRPVGAVPGPVTSAASAGTNLIIQDGRASLVTSAADVARLIPQ